MAEIMRYLQAKTRGQHHKDSTARTSVTFEFLQWLLSNARKDISATIETTAMHTMAIRSGNAQGECQSSLIYIPIDSTPMEPTSFMTLSLELRLNIYDYALEAGKPNHPSNWSTLFSIGNIPVVPDKKMSIALLLASKQISLEASQRYWSTTTYQLPIQHFELRLLFVWTIITPGYRDDSPLVSKEDRLLLYDALVSMLWKISSIQSFKLVIPCLCNRTYGWDDPRLTPDAWSSILLPILQPLLSHLRIKRSVAFVPTSQEWFPPCPLRRCKALVQNLQGVKSTVEGDTPIMTTECPTEKYSCERWLALNASANGHPVDCGCDEVSRVEYEEAKQAKQQEDQEWDEYCDRLRRMTPGGA
ncbi:MAG: hypothetical protein Q9207_008294, partial [Kuettlingeria erythrocarpa]